MKAENLNKDKTGMNDNLVELVSASGECVLKGIPSSPGISIGKAFVIKPETIVIPDENISKDLIPEELERFEKALEEIVNYLLLILNKVKTESKDAYAVIETNILILSDSIFTDSIKKRISSGKTVEHAVIQEFDYRKNQLKLSKDSILRERSIELELIKERFLRVLRTRALSYSVDRDSIVIAQSVTPADIVNFYESGVLAIITELGGISSHSSILARTFEIPEVIGIKDATQLVSDKSTVIVDGYTGIVTLFPRQETITGYQSRKSHEDEQKKILGKLIKLPSKTNDGKHIHLLTNVNFTEDIESSIVVGAEGIGLVRTEILLTVVGSLPSEEEQFLWYSGIAQQVYPNVVTFRAFDFGSDKYAEGMPHHEANPALGFRGIRFLLKRKDVFRSQILAILRASKNKNVRIMLPMIATVNEVVQSLALIEESKAFLIDTDVPIDRDIPVGIMIETPAAALQASALAKYSHFFSIGTNDLTQYTIAADRTNEYVAELFDSFHPAVLKLIKMTVDAAIEHKIPVGVCGEFAGHSAATGLLIGLGVTELSVSPSILLELKNRVRETNYQDAVKLADLVLNCSTYNEVRKALGII